MIHQHITHQQWATCWPALCWWWFQWWTLHMTHQHITHQQWATCWPALCWWWFQWWTLHIIHQHNIHQWWATCWPALLAMVSMMDSAHYSPMVGDLLASSLLVMVSKTDSAASIPLFMALCVPLIFGTFMKPGLQPIRQPPGKVSLGMLWKQVSSRSHSCTVICGTSVHAGNGCCFIHCISLMTTS